MAFCEKCGTPSEHTTDRDCIGALQSSVRTRLQRVTDETRDMHDELMLLLN